MTKKDLIERIAGISGVESKVVEHVLNIERDVIKDALNDGEEVRERGFGTFQVKTRAARKGRNPLTGDAIDIPEKKVIQFKPGFKLD